MKKIILIISVLVLGGLGIFLSQNDNINTQESISEKKLSSQPTYNDSMNINQLLNGNYSSVQGTWKNKNNQILVFDESGLISQNIYEIDDVTLSDGQITNGIFHQLIGLSRLAFVPANISGNPDESDVNKDRMIITQSGLALNDNDFVFYRE